MRVSTIRALEEMFFEQKRLCVPSFPTTSPHHTYHSQHSHSSAPSTDNPRTGSQRHPFACTPRPPAHTPRFVTVAALNRDGRSPGTRGRISGKASASSAETTYQASNYTAIHLRFREPPSGALRETIALVSPAEPMANVFHFLSTVTLPPNQLQAWSAGAIKADTKFKLEFDPARPATEGLRRRAGLIPRAAPEVGQRGGGVGAWFGLQDEPALAERPDLPTSWTA